MRIAVLGARGTVGGFLYNSLMPQHHVTGITRDDVDLSNADAVCEYFSRNPFDIVFNAAINNDSRVTADARVAQDNFNLFTNLYAVRNMFGRVIHFASGAEFDQAQPITEARESDLFRIMPRDPYGMSKNVTSRIAYTTDNWYTLRLFGVFHPTELPRRLLPKILSNQPVTVTDKYFDYLNLQDLLPVAEAYINDTPVHKDMNLVYPKKILLSEFVKRFCSYHLLSGDNITYGDFSELSYTGNGDKWASLNMTLQGIDMGMIKYK
jgi:nucleoside-diphosphate-sugar epimerase